MRRFVISGDGRFLDFDLRDVLLCLGGSVLEHRWTVLGVECLGPAAAELHELSDQRAVVSGAELLGLAERIDQTVDGTFEGRTGQDDTPPMLMVQAIDSTTFVVESAAPGVLEALERHFGRRVAEDRASHEGPSGKSASDAPAGPI